MDDKNLQIISMFQNANEETITAKTIADKLECSTRSVFRYINAINSLDDTESFRIVAIHNKGFKLQVLNEMNFEEFCRDLPSHDKLDDTQALLLGKIILFEPSMAELEQMLNYSSSSIIRIVNTINSKMENRRMIITRSSGKYLMEGNEIQIRNFMQYILENYNVSLNNIRKNLDYEYDYFKNCFYERSISFTEEIFTALFISMLRFSNNHQVYFNPIIRSIYEKNIETASYLNFIENFYRESNNKKVTVDEKLFIVFLLRRDEIAESTFAQSVNTLSPIINMILKRIDNLYKTSFANDDALINAIYCHVSNNIPKYIMLSESDNEILDQIRLNYTNEHVYALEMAKSLSELLDISLSDDDVGYITLHFANSNERQRKNDDVNSYILYKNSLTTAKLLKMKLHDNFPALNVSICNLNDAYMIESNALVFVYEEELFGEGRVKLSPFMGSDDRRAVNSAIIEKVGLLPFLNISHTGDFYICENEFKNRQNFLKWATEELSKNKKLTKEEATDILERENLSSTEIAPGVAFPHCLISSESFIAFFILKQPVLWHKNYVKLVLLMGYNSAEAENKKAITFLFNNLSDQKKIEKLFESKNLNEFIKILKG